MAKSDKSALQLRCIEYLKRQPNRKVAKAIILDIARKATGATGETTGRRLRNLAEASEHGANPQSPNYNEQLKGLERLNGAKIKVEHRDKNHCFYWYEPSGQPEYKYEYVFDEERRCMVEKRVEA